MNEIETYIASIIEQANSLRNLDIPEDAMAEALVTLKSADEQIDSLVYMITDWGNE